MNDPEQFAKPRISAREHNALDALTALRESSPCVEEPVSETFSHGISPGFSTTSDAATLTSAVRERSATLPQPVVEEVLQEAVCPTEPPLRVSAPLQPSPKIVSVPDVSAAPATTSPTSKVAMVPPPPADISIADNDVDMDVAHPPSSPPIAHASLPTITVETAAAPADIEEHAAPVTAAEEHVATVTVSEEPVAPPAVIKDHAATPRADNTAEQTPLPDAAITEGAPPTPAVENTEKQVVSSSPAPSSSSEEEESSDYDDFDASAAEESYLDSLKHQVIGVSPSAQLTAQQEEEISSMLDNTELRTKIASFLRTVRQRMDLDGDAETSKSGNEDDGQFGSFISSANHSALDWMKDIERRMREGEIRKSHFHEWISSMITNLENDEGDGEQVFGNMLDDDGNPLMDLIAKTQKTSQETLDENNDEKSNEKEKEVEKDAAQAQVPQEYEDSDIIMSGMNDTFRVEGLPPAGSSTVCYTNAFSRREQRG